MLERFNTYFEVDFTKDQLIEWSAKLILMIIAGAIGIGLAIVKNTIL